MAECYKSVSIEGAIKCYQQADTRYDKEGIALNELAKLYQELGKTMLAVECYAKNLQRRDAQHVRSQRIFVTKLKQHSWMDKKLQMLCSFWRTTKQKQVIWKQPKPTAEGCSIIKER
jgi:tetratricopeptide (TPR) repeat protein